MPSEKPPFDLSSFLKGQRALAGALLDEVTRAESSLPEGQLTASRLSTASATSGGFFAGIVISLLVLAGFLVLRPPPPPSPEVLRLRKELLVQKDAYDRQLADLNNGLLDNQRQLVATQNALRETEKALINTQQALRNIQQASQPAK